MNTVTEFQLCQLEILILNYDRIFRLKPSLVHDYMSRYEFYPCAKVMIYRSINFDHCK